MYCSELLIIRLATELQTVKHDFTVLRIEHSAHTELGSSTGATIAGILIESHELRRNCHPRSTVIRFLVITSSSYPHNLLGSRKKFQFICRSASDRRERPLRAGRHLVSTLGWRPSDPKR